MCHSSLGSRRPNSESSMSVKMGALTLWSLRGLRIGADRILFGGPVTRKKFELIRSIGSGIGARLLASLLVSRSLLVFQQCTMIFLNCSVRSFSHVAVYPIQMLVQRLIGGSISSRDSQGQNA